MSFRYVLTVFALDFWRLLRIANQVFFPLFKRFSIPSFIFPDGTNVNPKYVYCFTDSISLLLKKNLYFFIVAPGLLKIIIFVLLIFTSKPHFWQNCSILFIFSWSPSFVKANITKSSAKSKELIGV